VRAAQIYGNGLTGRETEMTMSEATTEPDLEALWKPIKIGSVEIANRVMVPAHLTGYGAHLGFGDRDISYLEKRAAGGAGLVLTGGAAIGTEGSRGLTAIWPPEAVSAYRRLAEVIHRYDTKVFVQLLHNGQHDTGIDDIDHWGPVLSASDVPSPVYGKVPKAMEADDIRRTVEAYGRAAENARDAGLDGLELSGGHGYLICQFLSPLTNRRDDEYGGSLENRCRFPIEILTEIRRRCGTDFPVGIRLSFDEFLGDVGITPELAEENLAVLHGTGLLDYVNISAINYHTIARLVPPMTSGIDTGHFVPYAARAKRVVGDAIPVVVASAIRDVAEAAQIVSEGKADLVGMVRAHIADPAIAAKARSGRTGQIRRCVAANQGCIRSLVTGNMLTCTVNPEVGREGTLGAAMEKSATTERSILVVGGGPAGMKVAEVAAKRGHRVLLAERTDELGGKLRPASELPNRASWLYLIEDLEGSLRRHGVETRTGIDVDTEFVRNLDPDVTIVATGSHFEKSGYSISLPTRDGIPGLGTTDVRDPLETLGSLESVGRSVLIVDEVGDHLPAGLALMLSAAGHHVEIVTTQLFGGTGMTQTNDFAFVIPELEKAGVPTHSQSLVGVIAGNDVTVQSIWGRGRPKSITAETVILNMPRRSDDSLYRQLADDGVAVERIGDCLAPRNVDDAIFEGASCGSRL
jgi:2,4-dienoyl-CoA reductase-like NADH-dependent reductase (Old Yellow Enzyme family)